MGWTCMAANGTGPLLFIDDVFTDRSNRMNAIKMIGPHFKLQMDNHPKHMQKKLKTFLRQRNGKFFNGPSVT